MARHKIFTLSLGLSLSLAPAWADEGMWTFDNFPTKAVSRAYGVDVTAQWLDDVRAAAVRIPGCSASFVSKDGLVLTNHHCVVDCVQDLSTAEADYVQEGFLARSRDEEKICPGSTAEVLTAITDVTGRIKDATKDTPIADLARVRGALNAEIEKEFCADDPSKFRCQVVSLYRGGQYRLYRYRRYTEVKLAFAPELSAAFFGGDPDNFNFPRFALDSAFLRVYDDGKPVSIAKPLTWTDRPVGEGEPIFVVGNPGSTARLQTVAQLETQRDWGLQIGQLTRSELRGRLLQFATQSPENARIAADAIFGLENGFKGAYGRHRALLDPAFMAKKRAEEAELRARVAADPTLAAEIGDPWAEIEKAQAASIDRFLLNSFSGGAGGLFGYAATLQRAAVERAKPNADRLPEWAESRLPFIARGVLTDRPIYPALEELQLAFSLSKMREYLGADHPWVKKMLGKESPEGLAKRVVSETKLADPAIRKQLWEGGAVALAAASDPMIDLAARLDEELRALRKENEALVAGPVTAAAERIAKARFAVYGDSVYPDATFTLRLSYGAVKGWTYQGRTIEPFTRFAGLYDRATGADPFKIHPRWEAAKDKIDPSTLFNFTTTNDIIGGNSGSPAVTKDREVVGAAFDGNIHSLGGDYGYDGAINRTVIVSTAAITEALRMVYGAQWLVDELLPPAERTEAGR